MCVEKPTDLKVLNILKIGDRIEGQVYEVCLLSRSRARPTILDFAARIEQKVLSTQSDSLSRRL